jgi:hypothetical protein
MPRFWVSWWSEEAKTKIPIQTWVADRIIEKEKTLCAFCAVIEAENTDEIWQKLSEYYPEYEKRFCMQRGDDFVPPEKFKDFRNKVSFNPVKKPKPLTLEVQEAIIEAERNDEPLTKHNKPKCCKQSKRKNNYHCARNH